MGQFSWIYSDTNKQLLDDVYAETYLLVPKPFQDKYGKAIYEDCYDGYGDFGKYDVYELVALWNRENLPSETRALRLPKVEEYGGLFDSEKEELRKKGATEEEIKKADAEKQQEYCDKAILRYKEALLRNKDFVNNVPDNVMKEKYGRNYLREIGIDIACYDEDNATLKYPIKITTKEMEYEDVSPSLSDPDQGWSNDEYDDEYWDEDEW